MELTSALSGDTGPVENFAPEMASLSSRRKNTERTTIHSQTTTSSGPRVRVLPGCGEAMGEEPGEPLSESIRSFNGGVAFDPNIAEPIFSPIH